MDAKPRLTDAHRRALARIREREDAAFRARVPTSLAMTARARSTMPGGVPTPWMAGFYRTPVLWLAHGSGPVFTDVDGNRYLDFNLGDMSTALGYAHPRLTETIAAQAARGVQLFLPSEPATAVCEQLRLRFTLPQWQFTLSASTANTEALRIARVATGRQGVLLFAGKYHGQLQETLWTTDGGSGDESAGADALVPEQTGLGAPPPELAVVAFNDLAAAEQVLDRRRCAAVLVEGVLTNCGTVLPEPGFLPGLREACTRTGTLLVMDETHTQFDHYGGAVAHYDLSPDLVTGGKGIAGGIPIGAYGMTDALAGLVDAALADELGETVGLALGGTLFANALSLACADVVLTELMTPAEHERIGRLGTRLSDGIEAAARAHELPWRAHRFGARSGYCLQPELPRNAREAHTGIDPLFSDTRRVYLANRGVWDAISSAGPHAGFAHDEADIDLYLGLLGAFLDELCDSS
ncbi:aspartate aminotransferase family protein [Kitasatospora paracochleata]|uniref:Glutamate-1-semialdehyde 2,1-aminomutase n=1 Tax=Kitasatospora paracochleata TaxID=58354 RepID=A0ABT1JAG6_9ACTN|nr:aminotransferase class III-fold pyridoxal phosphate-dependent enzyme [Kitasatospora paracochleata]MCP2314447.1 glutamate-1-semialdehyde 2,1-aminomutase [Kitasatospora paracochleata]